MSEPIYSKNVFFFRHINDIGGIETFFWELAQKYGADHDITIIYCTGSPEQVHRLRKYVRVIQYMNQCVKCEKAFFNFNLDIIDNVEAKEYIQIAHGDYKSMGITPNTHPRLDRYLGVSKQVCATYEEVTGFKTELTYNPFIKPKPKKILNLISATRLSFEKGGKRMEQLYDALEKAHIPYIWTIFTTDKPRIKSPNIRYVAPRLDVVNYMANNDYLVQLSDNEGYCYSAIEALSVGTQVIVTDCPVFRELGVNEQNGFILPFDMKYIPVQEIYERACQPGFREFDYTPPEDRWNEILEPGESTYAQDMEIEVWVNVTTKYYDMERGTNVKPGDKFITTKARAEMLANAKVVEIMEDNDG